MKKLEKDSLQFNFLDINIEIDIPITSRVLLYY